MFKITNQTNYISFTFSSQLNHVDQVIQHCNDFIAKFDIKEWSPLRLALRELLINAIEHGNNNDPRKEVSCTIENISSNRFLITVKDQGDGFDIEEIEYQLSSPTQARHRGLLLVNQYCDELEFEAGGSLINAFLTLTDQTTYQVSQQQDFQVIQASGNITASTADELKSLLLKLTQSGISKIRLDLTNVKDIDSVGLSVLIALSNSLSEANDKKLEISNASHDCLGLFRIIRLDTLFDIKH